MSGLFGYQGTGVRGSGSGWEREAKGSANVQRWKGEDKKGERGQGRQEAVRTCKGAKVKTRRGRGLGDFLEAGDFGEAPVDDAHDSKYGEATEDDRVYCSEEACG